MTSTRLLNKRAVNHLLNSITKSDSSNKVSSSLSKNSDITSLLIGQSVNQVSRGFSSAISTEIVGKNERGTTSRAIQLCPIKSLTKNVRLSSTVASVNVPTTSLKRDASTQAQQQVVEQIQDSKYYESFRSSELEVVECSPSELRQKPPTDKLIFGHAFTDHMFRVDWDQENGWSAPLISKVHNLEMHPAAKVIHYAIGAFEGAKAFRGHDNKIRLFRLDQNVKRLLNSAKRLSLPEFDENELIKCIHKLVQLEQDWIPKSQGQRQLTSLYIRPTILGIEPSLGVANSKKAVLYVILSPAGPYFKTGFKPVSLYADPDFVRAWPGGAGNTKLASNYAPTIMVQKEAERLGLQQVLWLYGDDMKLTEVGTMNVFVSYRNASTGKVHLVTPPLTDGLILPGITRASILDLARQWGDVVCEERYVTISELQQLIHEERILEVFGAGTACIVCPISSIQLKDGTVLRIPYFDISNAPNPLEDQSEVLTRRILTGITDIQYGKVPHPWAQELHY